jgi:hypothetical protein
MNPISDTESEPDQNAPIVESLEKTKPKRKGVAPVAEEPKQVPPPKPKRQLTERQLEALAKAREKRALARKAKSENQPVENEPLKKEVKIETPEPEPVVEKKKRTYNKKAKAQPVEPKKVPEPEPEPVVEKKKRTYNKKAPAPKAEVAKIDFV